MTRSADAVRGLRWGGRAASAACCAALGAAPARAQAADSPAGAAPPRPDRIESAVGPPDARRAYVQYGLAFTVEDVLGAGPMCSNDPCILGSGGGIAVRVGFRPTERLYIGGSYELSKQEPNKLYLLGILQQVRAELRSYFPTGLRTTPFLLGAAGVAAYGNEWAVDTWGPSVGVGGGVEVQLSGGNLLAVSMLYRPIYFSSFVDTSLETHGAGIAQFLGVELAIEAQDAL